MREAVGLTDPDFFQDRVLAGRQLSAFVILRSRFKPQVIHPEPKYVRVLEGEAWRPYLGRRTSMFRPTKLLIYQWHDDGVTDLTSPFRGFLDVRKERGLSAVRMFLTALLAVLVGLVLLADVHWERTGLYRLASSGWAWLASVIAGTSVYAVVKVVLGQVKDGRHRLHRARRAFRIIEGKVYGHTG
jgi:hypothetical protein